MGIFGIFTYQHLPTTNWMWIGSDLAGKCWVLDIISDGFSARDALAMLVQRVSLIVGSTTWMLVKH